MFVLIEKLISKLFHIFKRSRTTIKREDSVKNLAFFSSNQYHKTGEERKNKFLKLNLRRMNSLSTRARLEKNDS